MRDFSDQSRLAIERASNLSSEHEQFPGGGTQAFAASVTKGLLIGVVNANVR